MQAGSLFERVTTRTCALQVVHSDEGVEDTNLDGVSRFDLGIDHHAIISVFLPVPLAASLTCTKYSCYVVVLSYDRTTNWRSYWNVY